MAIRATKNACPCKQIQGQTSVCGTTLLEPLKTAPLNYGLTRRQTSEFTCGY